MVYSTKTRSNSSWSDQNVLKWRSRWDLHLWQGAWYMFWLCGRARCGLGLVCRVSLGFLVGDGSPSGDSFQWAGNESLHSTNIIITYLQVQCKSKEISRVFWNLLTAVGKQLLVRSASINVRDSMSETKCQSWVYKLGHQCLLRIALGCTISYCCTKG
jgi:hypothetical protein